MTDEGVISMLFTCFNPDPKWIFKVCDLNGSIFILLKYFCVVNQYRRLQLKKTILNSSYEQLHNNNYHGH